jgi:hypothetical protein
MPYGIPNIDHDIVHPDSREIAERLVRDGWPELRRAFYGAREHLAAAQSRYRAAGIRKTDANERTADARRALEAREVTFRVAGQVPADADLKAEWNELERALESETAADAEVAAAATAMQAARVVVNRMINRLAAGEARGEKFRRKVVRIGRGNPSELLAADLAAQQDKRAQAEPVRNAGTPISTLKAEALAKLDALRGDPFRLSYADGSVEFRWPVIAIPAEHKLPARVVTAPDPVPLLLALFGEEVKARVLARIDADHAGDKSLRLGKTEKKRRLAQLRAEILELQYEEGALRVLLAGDGPEIAFRPEMDPLATLGVEVVR